MNLGFGLVVMILLMAGAFFILALFNRTKIEVLKFTSYALAMLAILGFIVSQFTKSRDLKISVLIFIVLSAIYSWFYRGALKDKDRN